MGTFSRAHGRARLLPLGTIAGILLGACAGDTQVFKTPPTETGLEIASYGLDPSDPGPLDEATVFALVRDAEVVRWHWAAVQEGTVEDPAFDPEALAYEVVELLPTGPPDPLGRRRWEVPLPARAEDQALVYWFEAEDGEGVRSTAPGRGAVDAVVVPALPVVIDFEWPPWPPMHTTWSCVADPSRVLDNAEDEATLQPGFPFQVIRTPIWRHEAGASVLANRAGVTQGVGVEAGGQFYFYPLMIMLWNEVANAPLGGRQTALSYCPLTDTALLFDTGFDPQALPKFHDYGPAGLYNSNLSVAIQGKRAGEASAFNQMLGFAFTGPEQGDCLAPMPSVLVEWSVWSSLHPDTWVLEGDPALVDDFNYAQRDNPYEDYWRNDNELRAAVAREDPRFRRKSHVLGILGPGDPVAIPLGAEEFVHHTESAGVPIVVIFERKAAIALERIHPLTGETFELRPTRVTWRGSTLFEDDTADPSLWTFEGVAVRGPARGTRLAWVPAMSAFWFAWYAVYPESRVEEPEITG